MIPSVSHGSFVPIAWTCVAGIAQGVGGQPSELGALKVRF
jgi:hypothetical protein